MTTVAMRAIFGFRREGRRRLDRGGLGRRRRFHRAVAFEQREQRIGGDQRIDIEHQPVAVVGDRFEGKGLCAHLGLEIEHYAQHPRAVARDAQFLDVGILAGDLAVQLGQRGRQFGALEIEHQALGVFHRLERVTQLLSGFDCDARVVLCGPDSRGDYLRECGAGQREQNRCEAEASQSSPAGECVSSKALRPEPEYSSRIDKSGGASDPAARSGHSTMHKDSGLKASRKPDFSHSVGSLNR